jgi:hypothetical protein
MDEADRRLVGVLPLVGLIGLFVALVYSGSRPTAPPTTAPVAAEDDLEPERAIIDLLRSLYDGGPEMFDLACEAQKGKLTHERIANRTVHRCWHSPTFVVGLSATLSGLSAATIAHVHRNRYPALQKVLYQKFGSPREQDSVLVYSANGIEYYLGREGNKTAVMFVVPTE